MRHVPALLFGLDARGFDQKSLWRDLRGDRAVFTPRRQPTEPASLNAAKLAGGGAGNAYALPSPRARSRSAYFCTLPVLVFGISANTIVRGHL